MLIVDIHAHILLIEVFKKLEKECKPYLPKIINNQKERILVVEKLRYKPVFEQLYNIQKRIQDMEKMRVDVQILSVTPFTFYYSTEPKIGLKLAQLQNDALAALTEKFSDRFVGIATLPLQDVSAAVEELRRVVSELGMKGIEIGSNINGKNLDSPELYPFYEEAQKFDIPIFVHPVNVIGEERMQKYYLSNLIGNPSETSLAIASLVFGGVLEKFPKLKFCFAHGGGFIPYQWGRLERGYKVRGETKTVISKPPSEYLSLIYFDTVLHSNSALNYLTKTFGSEKVLLGSDYPFDMGDPDPVSLVVGLELSDEEKEKILGKNATKLFKL